MKYLIDSDRVIDYLLGVPAVQQLVAVLAADGLAISIITYSEIYEGIYGGRDPIKAEQTFQAFRQGVQVLHVTEDIAKQNALIRSDLRARKLQVNYRALDLFIAATAITHGLTLVTGNVKDYGDVTGLTLY